MALAEGDEVRHLHTCSLLDGHSRPCMKLAGQAVRQCKLQAHQQSGAMNLYIAEATVAGGRLGCEVLWAPSF